MRSEMLSARDPVHDELIHAIRDRLEGAIEVKPFLQPGERVMIIDGAFSQLEAIFLANEGSARVVLLLNIVQTEQRLTFPVASVRKVG